MDAGIHLQINMETGTKVCVGMYTYMYIIYTYLLFKYLYERF